MRIFSSDILGNVNYGAILQVNSLSEYLNSVDSIESQLLQFFQKNSDINWQLLPKPKTYRDVVKNIYMMVRLDLLYSQYKKIKILRKYNSLLIPLFTEKYDQKWIFVDHPVADAFCHSLI